ncbi:hypothetical protein C0V97_07890 [Asaia sp. W19]|uniref:hypothetical protein n=1 Tax=unclassified Asaia TaxID=2685023 RepID=UPI000F8C54EE|nr:hypothetical protein [Asaia sp. W19]RUT26093.1 hypothetical protein C0V97_07890 [Asaia sp. W19]
MRRFLALLALLPSLAWAQSTKSQFVPPNGLSLDTPLGTARNADGSGVVTFATMQAGIAGAVTQSQLAGALTSYLTSEAAAATYAATTYVDAAVQTETSRAKEAEQANASTIASLVSDSVTQSDLTSSLSAYLTTTRSDARYATPSAVASAVQGEANRAKGAEQANASAIAGIKSDYITPSMLDGTLGGYVTGAALNSALSTYLTQAQATSTYLTQSQASSTYLPLAGGSLSGALNTQQITISRGDIVLTGGGSVLLFSGGRTGAYFSTNSFGDLVINTAVGGGGGIRMIPTTFASLPSSPPAGTEHYCSDCYIGSGAKGVNVLYNGTAWTGVSGAAISH